MKLTWFILFAMVLVTFALAEQAEEPDNEAEDLAIEPVQNRRRFPMFRCTDRRCRSFCRNRRFRTGECVRRNTCECRRRSRRSTTPSSTTL